MAQLLTKVTHMLQFLHQMLFLFALLRDDPLKPVTPLTNGAIDESLTGPISLRVDLFVFVYLCFFCFMLHSCCIIVSTVG